MTTLEDSVEIKGLWGGWFAATTLGFALGGALAAVIELFFFNRIFSSPFGLTLKTTGDLTLPLGILTGSLLSVLLQSVVLRRRSLPADQWVLAGIMALVVGLSASPSTGLYASLFGSAKANQNGLIPIINTLLIMGAALGFAQWLVLRSLVRRSWWWILASIVAWLLSLPLGWLLGLLLGFPLGILVSQASSGLLGGIALSVVIVTGAGAALGASLGFAISRLLKAAVV